MVESIVEERRPDTFRACNNCTFANKATERAKRDVLRRDDLDQVARVTITITCEGGNMKKGILRVNPEIRGTIKDGGTFVTNLAGNEEKCPGIREEILGVIPSE